MKSNNFKQSISTILTLLLVFSVTSCSVINQKPVGQEMKNQETQNQETPEADKKLEEAQGVMVEKELRFYDGELVATAKHLIENSLTISEINVFSGFSVDLNDTIAGNSRVIYSKVSSNKYGFKSLNEIEEFFASTYSNEGTIHKMSYRGDEPLFKEHNGQLYASSDGSSGTVGYSIEDWYSIYLTDVTETTAVVNYPLFYYWNGIDGAAVMHKNTITKIDGTWLLDNILEAEPNKLEEKISKKLGIRSIFFHHLGQFNISDFIEFEGETIEKNDSKYTNIGYVLSPEYLKINYLDWYNNEKTLNFKMYGDPERSWIWYSDTIL